MSLTCVSLCLPPVRSSSIKVSVPGRQPPVRPKVDEEMGFSDDGKANAAAEEGGKADERPPAGLDVECAAAAPAAAATAAAAAWAAFAADRAERPPPIVPPPYLM